MATNFHTLTQLSGFISDGGEMELPAGVVGRLVDSPDWNVPEGQEKVLEEALWAEVVHGPEGDTDFMAAVLLLDRGVTPR